jgi:hypothetical protein
MNEPTYIVDFLDVRAAKWADLLDAESGRFSTGRGGDSCTVCVDDVRHGDSIISFVWLIVQRSSENAHTNDPIHFNHGPVNQVAFAAEGSYNIFAFCTRLKKKKEIVLQ